MDDVETRLIASLHPRIIRKQTIGLRELCKNCFQNIEGVVERGFVQISEDAKINEIKIYEQRRNNHL
jgi:hypothetical protein